MTLSNYTQDGLGAVTISGTQNSNWTQKTEQEYAGQGTYQRAAVEGPIGAWTGSATESGQGNELVTSSVTELLSPDGFWEVSSGTGQVLEEGFTRERLEETAPYARVIAEGQYKGLAVTGTVTNVIDNNTDYDRATQTQFDTTNSEWITTGSYKVALSGGGANSYIGQGKFATASGNVWGTYGPDAFAVTSYAHYFGANGTVQ